MWSIRNDTKYKQQYKCDIQTEYMCLLAIQLKQEQKDLGPVHCYFVQVDYRCSPVYKNKARLIIVSLRVKLIAEAITMNEVKKR